MKNDFNCLHGQHEAGAPPVGTPSSLASAVHYRTGEVLKMLDYDDDEITRPTFGPLVVAIGCDEDVALRWTIAANAAGFILRTASVQEARLLVRSWRPMAVVLPDDVYRFDAPGFLQMAASTGSHLLSVSRSEADDGLLEMELRAVLLEARYAMRNPSSAPPPRRSGVRPRVLPSSTFTTKKTAS